MTTPTTYDGVPLWMGGNEAFHSAENLRLLNYMIMRGQQGFLTASAGKVTRLEVPGAGIYVGPGPFVVNSEFPGGDMQSYVMRILQNTFVPTTANTSPSTRYDLVILNVEDPHPSGGQVWDYPGPPGSDGRKFGPYWRPRIVENVPSNTICLDDLPLNRTERGWTALACALLTRPPGTNVVEASHIKPLNVVCNPLYGVILPPDLSNELGSLAGTVGGLLSGKIPIPGEFTDSKECVPGTNGSNALYPSHNVFKKFPQEAEWNVLVPPWATALEAYAVTSGLYQKATAANVDAHVWGETRFNLDNGAVVSGVTKFDQDEINSYDNRAPTTGDSTAHDPTKRPGNRITLHTIEDMLIPAAQRNKRLPFKIEGRQFNDAATKGKLIADDATNVYVILKFKEQP